MLKYKGVEGVYRYNKELKTFVGELKNTKFLVVFKGGSMKGLESSFRKSVDRYLSILKENNDGLG